MTLKYYRWSDNQKRIGDNFIYSKNDKFTYNKFGISLRSGKGDQDDYADLGNHLNVSIFGYTFITSMPNILKPHRRWVDTSHYGWSDNPAGGYWDVHNTEYGFAVGDEAIHLNYGAQTHDSTTDKTKVWFYPWQARTQIRHSVYDLSGKHFADLDTRSAKLGLISWSEICQANDEIKETCPSVVFAFKDYDGEVIEATTQIEEREWQRGEGKFKWLRFFAKNDIRRSLTIEFSKAAGRRKGSYKGGVIGTSIEMLPNELHEGAFKRYCEQNDMTYTGVINAN